MLIPLLVSPVFLITGVILAVVAFVVAGLRSQPSDSPADYLLQSRSSLDGEPWWERAAVARRMSIDANTCRVCQQPTTTQCSRCKSVKYCSIVCQRKDWGSTHKFECDNLKSLKQNAVKAAAAGATKPPYLDPNEDAPVPQQVLFSYDLYLQLRKNSSSCRRPPVGFTNLGNNCYANAALQCMLANRAFRAYLDQGLHSSSCNKPNKRDWCLLCELQHLCRALAETQLGDEVSLRPLLRHLRRFAKTMSYGRQEDAHEFFYSLLNTMEAIQLTNFGGKERFDMRSQETTLVHHVFGGYLRCQVLCGGCGVASRRYEACLDLQLEVPPAVDRLEDVLARHTADEILDGDNSYACDGCKQRCRATRSTRFEVAPNSLVLCLKRFGTGRFGKINKMLVYGEKLDLGPFMAEGAMDEGEVTYTLTGVIVHLDQMNSTSFGHYICFVRSGDGLNGNGQWYACDDSRVGRTSASHVLSQNAYMLFYQRDTPKPAPDSEFRRTKPLWPPTAAQLAAAAAAERAPEAVKANGRAAAANLLDTQQLDQQQEQHPSLPAAEAGQGMQQQQRPETLLEGSISQPQPAQPLESAELLPRIATAPAALGLLSGHVEGSSSKGDEDESVSRASSLCHADAEASECSTPSSLQGSYASANAWSGSSMKASSSTSMSNGSSSKTARPGVAMEQQQGQNAAADPTAAAAAGLGTRDKEPAAGAAAGSLEAAGAETAATPGTADSEMEAGACPSSSNALPVIAYQLTPMGPELLRLRAELPGVAQAADIQVAVGALGSDKRYCLWLNVPGRFEELQLPLAGYLHPGQTVGSVTGMLSRRRQRLKLHLHLLTAVGTGEGSSSSNAAEAQAAAEVAHWHVTDAYDTSSGSESDGFLPPRRSMHAIASEHDLSSFFGRHSSSVAHQLMQQHLQQQAAAVAGGESEQQQQHDGSRSTNASKKPASKRKAGSKKKKHK